MAKIKRNPAAKEVSNFILNNYEIESVSDIQEALKEILGDTMESMLQKELDIHLDYEKNKPANPNTTNRRNGTSSKKVKSSAGEIELNIPRDRETSFEPQVVKKGQKDISDIEDKIIKMYARGMSQRDISQTIDEIYGFEVSKDMVSKITDKLIPEIDNWNNRQLKECYPFIFVDCMYVSMKHEHQVSKRAVYTVLGYDLNGNKEILGIWFANTESKHEWMNIFDEIKKRGVKSIFFIAMDGVSGLEAGAKAIFKDVIVQRCIVHLIRNATKFIPSKDMKEFTGDLKAVYAAVNLKTCESALDVLNDKWKGYPGAIRVINDNITHIKQLYSFGSDVRRIMYTTNSVESIHASFRKVTKKGTFESENSVMKALYLRILELERKWQKSKVRNWSMVLNQLMIDDRFSPLIEKYIEN